MKSKYLSSINSFATLSGNLSSFGSTYQQLIELNQILTTQLPKRLKKCCHVGAVDVEKKLLVVFVSEQMAYHTLNNMAQQILHGFTEHNYYFDSILIKVRNYPKNIDLSERYKNLDSIYQQKLKQIAKAINKPEIVVNKIDQTTKEIDL